MPASSISPTTANLLQTKYAVTWRQDWCVLKASGSGVRDYLQGQITQDMGKLTREQGIHACLLTPQGKAVSELYLLEENGDELILLVPTDHAIPTVARLRQFALGYALRIGIVDEWNVLDIQGSHATDGLQHFDLPEPEQEWLCTSHADDIHALAMPQYSYAFWVIGNKVEMDAMLDSSNRKMLNADQLEAIRIIHGIPRFGVDWNEKVYPMNANLIEFNGVSFDKGCYVGQEVTSRMQWRGGIKKRFYRVKLENTPGALPCPVLTTARIGMLTSAATDAAGICFGIAHLAVEVAESDASLSLENGTAMHIIEACHA